MICEALSDRMPAVARGGASWDAEEAAHFDICLDCQAEWSLVCTTHNILKLYRLCH